MQHLLSAVDSVLNARGKSGLRDLRKARRSFNGCHQANVEIPLVIVVSQGSERHVVGVAIPPDDVNGAEVVDSLWSQWRQTESHPDSDAEFIDWLVQEQGWKAANVDCHVLNLG